MTVVLETGASSAVGGWHTDDTDLNGFTQILRSNERTNEV